MADTGFGLVGLPADDVRQMDSRSGLTGRQVGTTQHSQRHLQDEADDTDAWRAGGKGQGRNNCGIRMSS